MPKQRRLTDLYHVGQEVTFTDPEGGDDLVVLVRKLNSVDSDHALRRANAARARAMIDGKDRESDAYLSFYSQAQEMGRQQIIEFLAADDIQKAVSRWEAEIGDEDEWSKDNYLQGLRESWDELEIAYFTSEEDESFDQEKKDEAEKVFSELKRFADVVEKQVEGDREQLISGWDNKDDGELFLKGAEKLLELQADSIWLNEYRRSEIWLAVRDPQDHTKRYFQNRDEVDLLSSDVTKRLLNVYQDISVDAESGKGSGEAPTSSESPEQPEPEVTETSSGPEAATE